MPSKNSINRPKQKINLNRKIQKNSAKRNFREREGLLAPSRSSNLSKSGQIRSVPLDIYRGVNIESGPITTKTLSKKRAKKIERNLKYAQQRKLLTDVQSKYEDDMDVDITSNKSKTKKTNLDRIKDILSMTLDDVSPQGLIFEDSDGTTLGGQYFP